MDLEKTDFSMTVIAKSRSELVQKLRAYAEDFAGAGTTVTNKNPFAANGKSTGKKVEEPSDDDGFVTEAAAGNGFDDEDTAPEENEILEKKAPPAKTVKPKLKKITLDSVNDACKAHAAIHGVPATRALLMKKFKTQSVTALKPEQWETCIALVAVT